MILGMLVWIAVFCWVALASMRTYRYYNSSLILAVVCIIAGISFPVSGIFWCYSHRMVRTQRETQKKMLDQRITELEQCRQDAKKAVDEIPAALMGGTGYSVTVKKTLPFFADEQGLASLNTGLTGGYKITFLLSTLAFALIMLLASTSDVVGIVSGLIYCGGISAFFCIEDELHISIALLVILGEIVSLCILWAIFGKYLLLGALGLAFVAYKIFL